MSSPSIAASPASLPPTLRTRIKNEVALNSPDLVIWQVGTDDALAFVPVEELTLHGGEDRALAEGAQGRRRARRPAIRRAGGAGRALLPVRELMRKIAAKENVMIIRRYEASQFIAAAQEAGGGFCPHEFERTEAGYNCLAQYLASAIRLGAFGKGLSGRPLRGQARASPQTSRSNPQQQVSRAMPVRGVAGHRSCARFLICRRSPASPAAHADAVADFYKGKDLRMIVSTTVGHRLRHLCARGGASPAPPHPRQSVDHRAEHAGRRRPLGREPHLLGGAPRTAPSSA